MQIDEEFKNLIPKLSEEEFKQLKENILTEGCREPIIVWNNIIIDGHNRYKICTENNITFTILEKQFEDREKAKMWIIKNQFGRRNLSIYDRSILALKLEDIYKQKAKQNQGTRTDILQKSAESIEENKKIIPIDTREEIARIAGTSHDTIFKVKKIEEKAPKEVKEKVKNGEMSINQAYGYAKTYEYLDNQINNKKMQKETKEDNEYLKEQFREIERIKGTEIRMNDAIFKILTVEVNEENVQIWMNGLDEYERQNMNNKLNEIIKKYEFIKKMWENHNKIRRIK